jgi:N-acetyl-anhydromuramyl-L-alanine amidase AmpD
MTDPKAHPLTTCRNFNDLKEPRLGVMLHYDDSSNDSSAVEWFTDPECKVSYNVLVLDDGSFVPIVPPSKRAWHAGSCSTSDASRLAYRDANSAFLGVAVATNDKIPATAAQLDTVVWLVRSLFAEHGWPTDQTWRIVGHDTEAIWSTAPDVPAGLRGKRGRKIDPTGTHPDRPILSVDAVRARVAAG